MGKERECCSSAASAATAAEAILAKKGGKVGYVGMGSEAAFCCIVVIRLWPCFLKPFPPSSIPTVEKKRRVGLWGTVMKKKRRRRDPPSFDRQLGEKMPFFYLPKRPE